MVWILPNEGNILRIHFEHRAIEIISRVRLTLPIETAREFHRISRTLDMRTIGES